MRLAFSIVAHILVLSVPFLIAASDFDLFYRLIGSNFGVPLRLMYAFEFLTLALIAIVYFHFIFFFSRFFSGSSIVLRNPFLKSVDYLWYAFGAILLSLFAVDQMQVRDIEYIVTRTVNDANELERTIPAAETAALMACDRLRQEPAPRLGVLGPSREDFEGFCTAHVESRSYDRQFFSLCQELGLIFLASRPPDSKRRLRPDSIAFAFGQLCITQALSTNSKRELKYLSASAGTFGSLSQTINLFYLLSALVGLKLTKTSADLCATIKAERSRTQK